MRIGEMLVSAGLMTPEQTELVLRRQQSHPEPFGLLAQRMFGIDPRRIEEIWAETTIRLSDVVHPSDEEIDVNTLDLVTRRQAWQFRIVPVRWDDGALVLATTREHLQKALRFATNGIPFPVYFVVADTEALTEGLERHYPMGGLGRRVVEGELEQIATNLASRGGSAA